MHFARKVTGIGLMLASAMGLTLQPVPLERTVTEVPLFDGDAFAPPLPGTLVVSPDNTRVSSMVRLEGRVTVVLDGKQGRAYDNFMSTLVFSPNSKRYAYLAMAGGKRVVVVDGREENAPFDAVAGVVFSADSSRLIYTARTGGKWFVVVNGKPGRPHDKLSTGNIFAGLNDRIAYGAYERGRAFVIVDGKDGPPYSAIADGSLVMSPDGTRVAYTAVNADRTARVVVDGVEQPVYQGIDTVVFSANSKHYAYSATSEKNAMVQRGVWRREAWLMDAL